MDKVIIPFEDIRGLGDIISPKSLSDYIEGIDSVLTEDNANINDLIYQVLEMNYYIIPEIIVNAPTNFIAYVRGTEITIPITVTDENNNPIHDIRFEFNVDNDFTGPLITNEEGTVNFTYALVNHNFTVDFTIPETDHTPEVKKSVTIITGCTLTLRRIGYTED